MTTIDKSTENPHENIVTLGGKANMNQAAIRPDAIREHLQKFAVRVSLFGCNGKIIIASFGQDPDSGKPILAKIEHFNPNDVDGMVRYVEQISKDRHRNVYLSYSLMRNDLEKNRKGGLNDVVAVFGLCADFDDEHAADYLERLPMEPDSVSETSQGRYQAVYLLDRSLERSEATEIAERLQEYSNCDHCSKDLAHVWRVAGTLNWPNQKKVNEGRSPYPQEVRCVYKKESGAGTSVDELKGKLEIRSPQKKDGKAELICLPVKEDLGIVSNINVKDLDLNPKIEKLILNGSPKGKRSSAIWSVILSLVQAWLEDKAIINIILSNPIGEKAHEKTDPEKWLIPQIKKAHEEIAVMSNQDNVVIDMEVIERALKEAENDPTVLLEEKFIETLAALQSKKPAEYDQFRNKAKKIPGIRISTIDKAVNKINQAEAPSSQLNRILFLRKKTKIFRSPEGQVYLDFEKGDHREIYPIGSKESDRQISYMIFEEFKKPLDEKSLKEINRLFEGIAFNEGEILDVFLRHGFYDGIYFVDLCNEKRQCLRITQDSVSVINNAPIAFTRTPSMKSLPLADGKGDVSLLWKYINIDPKYQLLILAFILESFRPDTQYIILELIGTEGSGKSSVASTIRSFIDPHVHNLIGAPKDTEDIHACACNNAILNYNNLSGLSHRAQDALCCISTGGSAAGREFFTNFGEAAVRIQRPVIINCLRRSITKNDLLSRAISFEVPILITKIPDRRFKKEFENDKATIASGIFDLFSKTLKEIPTIGEEPSERMGDFVILGEAMFKAMGKGKGEFTAIYKSVKKEIITDLLDDSTVATAILNYFEEKDDQFIKGYCKDLWSELKRYKDSNDESWPMNAKGFSIELRRITSSMRSVGIIIEFLNRTNKGIPVSIKKVSTDTSDSFSSAPAQKAA